MKRYKKFAIWTFSVLFIFVVSFVIFFRRDIRDTFGMFYAFQKWDEQMDTGRKYMDSLTEQDIQIWIKRTEKYLKEDSPTSFTIDAKPVPSDLQRMGIIRIDEGPNLVEYDWMGGMDHTELDVEQISNGFFQFTAVYDDRSNRVIWPKQP